MLEKFININDEKALERFIKNHIAKMERADAMQTILSIHEWADKFGSETFGPQSWANFKKERGL